MKIKFFSPILRDFLWRFIGSPMGFALLTIFIFVAHCKAETAGQWYSTAFLRDYRAVHKSLLKVGFRKITLMTSDGIKLAGLFLERPNATCNAVICAGWFPGRKEGMATFYDLLPENCNILLFDARGHGKSDGSLLWGLWRYGIDEYKDIIAAISHINDRNSLPVVILGICSGAFNAAHAVIHLENNKNAIPHNIKGLIFDSGWSSVPKIITTAPIAGIKKRLLTFLQYFCATKKQIVTSYFYHGCSLTADYICSLCNYVCAKPLARQYENKTSLTDKIETISIPLFFIHSYDDVYADVHDAIELSNRMSLKECWWIEKSSHAKHHLIYKDLYKEKLRAFINSVLY